MHSTGQSAMKRWMRRAHIGQVNTVEAFRNARKYDIRNEQTKKNQNKKHGEGYKIILFE